jgi:hypothetical protein
MNSRIARKAALGVALVVVGSLASAASATADSMTQNYSYTDPRGDWPARSGTVARGLYGPYTISAASEIHNAINTGALVPCNDCYITDMAAGLVDSTTLQPVNLAQDVMLHHFVLIDRDKSDVVCPGGIQGGIGQRFFAAGNERTHLHLPSPYGYFNSNSSTPWWLIYHLVNKSPTASKSVYIEIVFRYRSTGIAATPLWLDIDGCGDSEYTAPTGYSDTHADWTSTISGRWLGISGHMHDVDITNLQRCTNATDDDADGAVNDGCPTVGTAEVACGADTTDNDSDGRVNDGCPAVGQVEGPCADHCAAKGNGIAVSAEIVGGNSGDYYGPIPPSRSPPADLTGATLCRSETFYGSTWAVNGGNNWRGHLDTMSLCGIQTELPAGHQAEAYPPDGAFPADGYPLTSGQVVRLHSEYQNDTGTTQPDVMGIMMGWVAPATPGYARPKAATPSIIRLVPAFNSCGGSSPSGMTHGAPLSVPSCSPPVQSSNYLTVGTPDMPGNGFAANSTGFVKYKIVGENPIDPTNGDQADVQVTGSLTDVRRKSNPSTTYTGQIQLSAVARITDKYNVGDQATAQDVPFNMTASCTSGTCSFASSFDAVMPDVIRENKRAVWAIDQVKVYDGGADDLVSTAGNTLFAVQGFYAP